ncbi:MAG: carboxypeptidase regulatory-like domain-containing protein [Terriglobia bacterium]
MRTPIPKIFLTVMLLLPTAAVWAGVGGRISGTVWDPSGAVIPGVTIAARNTETGLEESTTTNEEGFYAFPALPVGHYEIVMRHPGFKPYRQGALTIDANTALRVDARLELGPQTQTVNITEAGPSVETTNTQMGQLATSTKINSVPLNGRGFTDLLALQPGVIPVTSQPPNSVVMTGVSSISPSGDLNPGNLSISGQREFANGFTVNGSDVEEDVNMGAAVVPNLDSIAEFRILTNNFDAEYGNYSGGQIIVVTKAGANQFHGDGFEFLRNTSLDARNFFSSGRARFNQNQFGGTWGGPIRHDKVFFFTDYQGTQMTEGVDTGLISVPSLGDRSGDLADLAGTLTGTVNGEYWANLLAEKLGYSVFPGEPYYTPACATKTQCVLPNAQIPQQAWSVPARHLLQYIPGPNRAGNFFSTSASNETLRDDKGAARVDGNTSLGMLSAYFFIDDYSLDNPYPTGQGGASVPGFSAVTPGRAALFNLGATKTFGANSVNEFHLSFMRDANKVGQPVGGVGPSLSSQGFLTGPGTPGIVPLAPQIEGVENVSFNDFTFGVDTTGLKQVNNTFQGMDDFSKVIGTHTLKFGGGFHYDQINVNPNADYNGSFAFLGSETGVDFADFLLGVASSYSQADAQSFYNRNQYAGLYGQDSWRARRNLTLNYGLRWDRISPWYEKYNQLQTLILGEQSRVYPGGPTGLVFPGDPGVPRTLAPTRYDDLAPRIGLAYSPNVQNGLPGKILGGPSQTSIRVGYGLFFTAFEGLSAGIMSANPPYGYDYTSFAPVLFATPFIMAASGQNIGQRFPLSFPAFGASASRPNSDIDWSRYLPITGVPSFYQRNVPPYAENIMLSLERKIGANTLLSFSYVGTQAHHLLVLTSANPGNPALCLSLSQPDEVMSGTPTCGPFGESGLYTTPSGKLIQGTRGPFSSQFAAITYQKTIGNSDYNALEVNLRHESGPLEFLVGYTYSKSIDQSSSLAEAVNPVNPQLSRALSAFDMRHNFVASYTYKLPVSNLFHRGSRWTEGWALSGITRFTTGLPATLYNNNDTSLLGTIPNGINNNGVDTPNFTPGNLEINRDPRDGNPAFNTSLFSLPALGQIGTAARRFFCGPGIDNFDIALLKKVQLTESKSLQFRLEAFNVLNHPQFYGAGAVNGNISSAAFGEVVSAAPPRILQAAAKFCF